MLTLKSTFQMLTEQFFLARPSVTQMSNDVHLLAVAGAAGVLAGALPPTSLSLIKTCTFLVHATYVASD